MRSLYPPCYPYEAQETSRKRCQGVCKSQNLLLNQCVPDMTDTAIVLSWTMFLHKTPQDEFSQHSNAQREGAHKIPLEAEETLAVEEEESVTVCPCFSGSPTLRCVLAALIELNGPLQKIRRGAEVGRGNVWERVQVEVGGRD